MKKTALLLCLFTTILARATDTVNTDVPLRGKHTIALQPVWSIEGVGNELFGAAPQLTASPDGRLYVYDPRRGINYILDRDHNLLTTFAPRGEGPGEIKRQMATFLVSDQVMICDMDRIHHFSTNGRYIDTSPNHYFSNPVSFWIDKRHFVSASNISLEGGKKGSLSLSEIGHNEKRLIKEYDVFTGSSVSEPDGRRMVMLVEFLTPMMLASWNGKQIFYAMNDRYQIRTCNLDGQNAGQFSLTRPNKAMSMEDKISRFPNSGGAVSVETHRQFLRQLPNRQTQFVRMEARNTDLLVWVTDAKRDKTQEIDVFDKNGRYIYQLVIQAPAGYELMPPQRLNPVFCGDDVYLILEDEDGEIGLHKCRMALPPDLSMSSQ